LREVLKSEAAAAIILYDDGEEPGSSQKGVTAIERERPQSGDGVFWRFFDWIDKSSFEVAADAFTTFRVSLNISPFRTNTTHGQLAATNIGIHRNS
jgi:calcium binding protein 39